MTITETKQKSVTDSASATDLRSTNERFRCDEGN